jgi:hypothetical protein
MASPLVNVGTGTYLTFASVFSQTPSTSVYDITSASWSGLTRPEIDTTHMMTTASPSTFGGRTYIPGDFVDPGELTLEGHFNPDITPPIETAAGTATLVFAGTGSWVCTAAVCTSFELTSPIEDKMGFTCTIKMSGNVTVADG